MRESAAARSPPIELEDAKITHPAQRRGQRSRNSVRVDYWIETEGHPQLRHVLCPLRRRWTRSGPRYPSAASTRRKARSARRNILFLRRFDPGDAAASYPLIWVAGSRRSCSSPRLSPWRCNSSLPPCPGCHLWLACFFIRADPRPCRARGVRLRRSCRARASTRPDGLALGAVAGSPFALATGFACTGVSAPYGIATGRFAVLPALRARGRPLGSRPSA